MNSFSFNDAYMVQRQVDHYRGRVAATQGAIVNLCDKPLHDESAITRLQGLCTFMVNYRSSLNYWLDKQADCTSEPTVTDVTPRKCKMCGAEASGGKRGYCPECLIEVSE